MSRLICDPNRPPGAPSATAAVSEVCRIPGNVNLAPEERLARTGAVSLPFHQALHAPIARRLALGRPPVPVTVHSFTPVWHGRPRAAELGVIHDADPAFARRVAAAAAARTQLRVALNEPCSPADRVTHALALHATAYGLAHAMLAVRNGPIARPESAEAMAATLAPVLRAALPATPAATAGAGGAGGKGCKETGPAGAAEAPRPPPIGGPGNARQHEFL